MEKEQSEFGKGLCYCLGLFLAHAELDLFRPPPREKYARKSERDKLMEDIQGEMWFNGASDHLYDLQIETAPGNLRDRLETFRDLCLKWGHGFPEKKATMKDVAWAIQEAKDLLLSIDKANGVETQKGQWE